MESDARLPQMVLISSKTLDEVEKRSRSISLRPRDEVLIKDLVKEFENYGVDKTRLGMPIISMPKKSAGMCEIETISGAQLLTLKVWNMHKENMARFNSFPIMRLRHIGVTKNMNLVDGRHRIEAVRLHTDKKTTDGEVTYLATHYVVQIVYDFAENDSRFLSLKHSRKVLTNAPCITDMMNCLPEPGTQFSGLKELLKDKTLCKKLLLPDNESAKKVLAVSFALFPSVKQIMSKHRSTGMFNAISLLRSRKGFFYFLVGFERFKIFQSRSSERQRLFQDCSLRFKEQLQICVVATAIAIYRFANSWKPETALNRTAFAFSDEISKLMLSQSAHEKSQEKLIWKTFTKVIQAMVVKRKNFVDAGKLLQEVHSVLRSALGDSGTEVFDMIDAPFSTMREIRIEKQIEDLNVKSSETEMEIEKNQESLFSAEMNVTVDLRERSNQQVVVEEEPHVDSPFAKQVACTHLHTAKSVSDFGIITETQSGENEDIKKCQEKQTLQDTKARFSDGTNLEFKNTKNASEGKNLSDESPIKEAENKEVESRNDVEGILVAKEIECLSHRLSVQDRQCPLAKAACTEEPVTHRNLRSNRIRSDNNNDVQYSRGKRNHSSNIVGKHNVSVDFNTSEDEHSRQALTSKRRRSEHRLVCHSKKSKLDKPKLVNTEKRKMKNERDQKKERKKLLCLQKRWKSALELTEWFCILGVHNGMYNSRVLFTSPGKSDDENIAIVDQNDFWEVGKRATSALEECAKDGTQFSIIIFVVGGLNSSLGEEFVVGNIVYERSHVFIKSKKNWDIFKDRKVPLESIAVVYRKSGGISSTRMQHGSVSSPNYGIWCHDDDARFLRDVFLTVVKKRCNLFDFTCGELFVMGALCEDDAITNSIAKFYRAMPYSFGTDYKRCFEYLRQVCLADCDCEGHCVLQGMEHKANEIETAEDVPDAVRRMFRCAIGNQNEDIKGDIEIVRHSSLLLRRTKTGVDPLVGVSDEQLCSASHDKNGEMFEHGAFVTRHEQERVMKMKTPSTISILFPRGELVDAETASKEFSKFLSPFDLKTMYVAGLTETHLWYFMNNNSLGSLFNTIDDSESVCVYLEENYKKASDFRVLLNEGFKRFLQSETGFLRITLDVGRFKRYMKMAGKRYTCKTCGAVELFTSYGNEYYL